MLLYKAYMINVEYDPELNIETPIYTSKEECIKHAEYFLNACTSPSFDEYGRVVETPDFSGYAINEVPVYTHFDKNNKR